MNTKQYKQAYCGENDTAGAMALGSCQKLAAQIEHAKDELTKEFSARLAGHESVLRMALSEAEAMAWETNYPQLVFATLAMEKAQAAASWENRQQLLSSHSPAYAPAEGAAR